MSARVPVCFVTGTRAELGLMTRALHAIRTHKAMKLQLVVTGQHFDRSRGGSPDAIRTLGLDITAEFRWGPTHTPAMLARSTGRAIARLTDIFKQLDPKIVLVVGDRVEAFSAATAAHLGGRLVSHVHGGDVAEGQVDDSLRHAISKLAHLHLAACESSAARLLRMGEDPRAVHVVGSPGVESIRRDLPTADELRQAGLPHQPAGHLLLLLHPTDSDEPLEYRRVRMLLRILRQRDPRPVIMLMPNTDPGSRGIIRGLREAEDAVRFRLIAGLPRRLFLGLLGRAAGLVGNSSAGLIEAPSLGTWVLDIGPRQNGRTHAPNVRRVRWHPNELTDALDRLLADSAAGRFTGPNPYHRPRTAQQIANLLAKASRLCRTPTKRFVD